MSAKASFDHGGFYGVVSREKWLAQMVLSHRLATPDANLHTHQDAHFIWITGGQYMSEVAGDDDNAAVQFHPVGTTHRDSFKRGVGSFLTISVTPERIRALEDGISLPDHPVLLQIASAQGLVRKLLLEDWNGLDSDLLLESLCLEMIGVTCSPEQDWYKSPPGWLSRARDYLDENSSQSFAFSKLARAVGVHPVHLTRTFRTFFRCTPGEYLRSRRLERAAHTLTSTRTELSEVAFMNGFADQSHLTKHFSRAFGVSPARYRTLTTV